MSPYYSDDLVTLYHGDSLASDLWLSADVLVTDPPYGYSHKSSGGPRGKASWANTSIANDANTAAREAVLQAWGERPALVFGSWKSPRPADARMVLVWDKGGHRGMGDLSLPWKPNWEEIYVLGSGFTGARTSGVLGGYHLPPSETAGRWHPHEKPVALMKALLAKCPPGVVSDPFAGAGATLRAAADLGRKAVGFEVEERYCEVIARRLAQQTINFGEWEDAS